MQNHRKRLYESILLEHFAENRQMAFLSGPRQSGKTTVAETLADIYLDWDTDDVRSAVVSGQNAVADRIGLGHAESAGKRPLVVFDEIHKYGRWKTFLKGFFDIWGQKSRILATGSARMDVYKRGGDSLMGRYFPYRMHPFSVAELLDASLPDERRLVRAPRELPAEDWAALLEFGGFPEPFTRRNRRFSTRWNRLRDEQLLHDDVRDLSRVVELGQLSVLAELLRNRSGEQIAYLSLAGEVKADEKTVKSWVGVLKSLYYGFEVRPWFRNVENAIRKTPKWFLRDWSRVADPGKRFETMVACHLLKAVEGWTDLGYGEFALHYLRNKQKREVDFLVSRDSEPWFLVEAKTSDEAPTQALRDYQGIVGAEHAFQIVRNAPFVPFDCFAEHEPVSVPAMTFLSQLL